MMRDFAAANTLSLCTSLWRGLRGTMAPIPVGLPESYRHLVDSKEKRILTLFCKGIHRDDAFVGLRFEAAFKPIDTRQLNARNRAR